MSSYQRIPIQDTDLPFLEKLYASTREDELSVVPWTAKQKADFLALQFNAQHTYYQEQFKDAQFDLVIQENKPIGRLYVEERKDEVRIIDIALLPAWRGKGIGAKLMQDVMKTAGNKALPVRIHVEHNNPAIHLYQRLGFEKTGDTGVYFLMEWKPAYIND
jgi:ribosomal protein S18 acetylase RimI-like enzyme